MKGHWHRSVSLDDSLVALVLLAALIYTGVQGFESPPWWAAIFSRGKWTHWGDKWLAKLFLMLQDCRQSFWSCASCDIYVAYGSN